MARQTKYRGPGALHGRRRDDGSSQYVPCSQANDPEDVENLSQNRAKGWREMRRRRFGE